MTGKDLMIGLSDISPKYYKELETASIEATTKHGSMRRPLLIAAVISLLLLLVGCAVAYVVHNLAMIETIFGKNGRESYAVDMVRGMYEAGGERMELDQMHAGKYLDPYIIPVNETLTDGQTSLTVLSYLVDRTACTAAVYMKMENPPKYEVYNSGRILFKAKEIKDVWYIHPRIDGQSNVIGKIMIDEASTTDQDLFCIFMFSCEPELTELELYIGDHSDTIMLRLPQRTKMPSVALEDGQIQITPLGMKVAASILKQDDDMKHPERNLREVAIQFKDGSEYLILRNDWWDSENDYSGYTYGMALNLAAESYVYIFNRIIEINNVAAFRVNDHIYKI